MDLPKLNNLDSILIRIPHIGETIFQFLGFQDLKQCSRVNRSWRNLIRKQKFWWLRMIESNPEVPFRSSDIANKDQWIKLLQNVDTATACKLGETFEYLRNTVSEWEMFAPVFAVIYLDDEKILDKMFNTEDNFYGGGSIQTPNHDICHEMDPYKFAAFCGSIESLRFFIDREYPLFEESFPFPDSDYAGE